MSRERIYDKKNNWYKKWLNNYQCFLVKLLSRIYCNGVLIGEGEREGVLLSLSDFYLIVNIKIKYFK